MSAARDTKVGDGGGGASAVPRRFKAGSFALVTLLAVTVSVVLLNALAPKFSRRYDVTATGEHKLAPRTEKLLSSLKNQYRVVLAGDFSRVDGRARDRVNDVLDQFARRSERVAVRSIDAASAAGQEEFDRLIAELAKDNRADLDAQSALVVAARDGATTLASYLDGSLAAGFEKVREALTVAPTEPGAGDLLKAADYFRDLAAASRIGAQDLRATAGKTAESLGAKVRGIPVPATDLAAAAIRESLSPAVEQLGALATRLKQIAESNALSPKGKDALRPVLAGIEPARDAAAVALDTIARLKRPDIRRVADVLSRGNAALVVGPSGVGLTAIEFDTLFPAAEWMDSSVVARADIGRRAEELFASAIGSLETPLKPIVVIVHGEARSFFELNRFVTRVRERMGMRGVDTIEWATATQALPPDLATLNADGKRPVVYASLVPNTSVGSGASGEKPGVERAKQLGKLLSGLADAGESLLISMSPSVLPTFGQPDPTTELLTSFGLKADTARPVVREVLTPRGRALLSDLMAQPATGSRGENAIALAIKGLPLNVEWPIALTATATAPAGVTVWPLYVAADDGTTWAESQWATMWALRGQIDREADIPTFDAARDLKSPSWLIAAAAERRGTAGARGQRVVAVGANTWYMDERSQAVRSDGRSADSSPGNLELFEASVYWLAGQDELIAQSPQARAVALVKPMSEGRVKLVRFVTIAVLPLLVLVIGVMYRWVRG